MSELEEVIEYLHEWKSNREIKEKFNLSQTRFYNLSRWLIKANIVKRCTAIELNRKDNGRITFYKIK